MNAKVLTVVLGILLLVPVGYAADAKFGDCPTGYSCEQTPDGDPFPPDAVTGHTIYASWVQFRERANTLGLPTDFAAIAGYFAEVNNAVLAKQRECVVWFNGWNLDQRPDPDVWEPGVNAFPSDEDETNNGPNHPNGGGDAANQDYDFDRDVEECLPEFDIDNRTQYSNYAVAVEKGDCNPADGGNFRFRGHLDFVDPNNLYHEVQEYDYECFFSGPLGGVGLGPLGGGQWFGGGLVPQGQTIVGMNSMGEMTEDFFPYTSTDANNTAGCDVYETPVDNADPANGDLGSFDLGNKCNGSVQDLFKERLWITPFHNVTYDPTIDNIYNFALQIDTCAGINIYELDGKQAEGDANNYSGAYSYPGPSAPLVGPLTLRYHDVAYHTYYSTGLDAFLGGWPLFDVCTDGSSFSFDDTPRGRVDHLGAPSGVGDEEIMRGNSYDFDPNSGTFGKHRTNCRHNDINWPLNTYPPGPPPVAEDCYPEDHKTAQIDIYVFDLDPTGLFEVFSNGLTGDNAYVPPAQSNGPNDYPPFPEGPCPGGVCP